MRYLWLYLLASGSFLTGWLLCAVCSAAERRDRPAR